MRNVLERFFLCLPIAFFSLSCGGDTTENERATEKLEPVEVFIQGVGLDVRRVAFSADGSRILTSGGKGTTVWDAYAGKELKTVFAKEAYSMAASPSGRFLVTYSPSDLGAIHICDFAQSSVRTLQVIPKETAGDRRGIVGLTISDDGKYIALEHEERIKVYDCATLELVHEIPLKDHHFLFNYRKQGLRFLPGSHSLLALSFDIMVSEPDVTDAQRVSSYSINIYPIDGTEPVCDIVLQDKFLYSWALSQDGKKLALLFMDKRIKSVDLTNGKARTFVLAYDGEVTAIGFRDNHSLVFAGTEGAIGTFNFDSNETRLLDTQVRYHFRAPNSFDVAVSEDGRRVAFCNGFEMLLLYDVATNQVTLLGDPAEDVLGTYFDRDASVNVITGGRISTQQGFSVVAREVRANELHSIFSDQVRVEDVAAGTTDIFDASIARPVTPANLDVEHQFYAWFTPDGKLDFYWKKTGQEGEPDRRLYVGNLDNPGADPVRLEKSDSYGHTIRVFDNNRKVLMAGFATDLLGIWDLQTGRMIDSLEEQSGNAEAFEFIDQERCLIGVRGNIKLYDLSNKSVVKIFKPTGYDGDRRDIQKIAFSPDKKYFATGDGDGLVTIWDMTKDNEIISFRSHKDWITSLAFSPDGKRIISGSHNGKSAVINDVATGRQLAQFVSFTDGEWILITPEGYFSASANGAKYLNVRTGNSVYSIDNFYERFYNPSYVASILGGAGETIAAASDIRKGFAPPPVVSIVSPSPQSEFEAEELTVAVGAKDMGGGIDEIRLYQNGKLVSEEQRGMKIVGVSGAQTAKTSEATAPQQTAQSFDATKSYQITLLPGANTFRAIAFNRERTESNPAEVTVVLKAAQAASDLYVFVVGINEYKNAKYNLNYGKSDAMAFGNSLAARSRSIFRNVVRHQLYDGKADRQEIEATFAEIAASAKPQDTFLFYFAGHGVMSEGSKSTPSDFYLVPSDVTQLYGDDEQLASRAISAARLKTLCTSIRAQKQLVVLDACQSGGAVESFATRGAAEERAIVQLARSAGTVLLASTATEQFATEFSSLAHGVFTYALLQGINGEADGGTVKDGKITVKELEAFLNDRVPELTKKYRGTAQYPNSYARGQDFPLTVK